MIKIRLIQYQGIHFDFTCNSALVEAKYNETVENCAISVPARFNQSERDATMTAATLTGLNVLKLTSEPVAAAKTYGKHYIENKDHRRILVYDFGGGTFDISIYFENKFQTGM